MRGTNTKLQTAKRRKDDEYYTSIKDIEEELQYYVPHFKDKIVYCNCDEYGHSEFVNFFINNFEKYRLKKLIATHYVSQEQNIFQESEPPSPKLFVMTREGATVTALSGDGDFRSSECMQLMRESDIVVTNPPFSIIRQFIMKLFETQVDFLFISPITVVSAVYINPYLCNDQMWGGIHYRKMVFKRPQGTEALGNCMWFTNLDHGQFPPDLELEDEYHENKYPHYDNIDAIECSISRKPPKDWDGMVGVPVSWIAHYNRKQFKIVGQIDAVVNERRMFRRLLIQKNNTD